MRVNDHGDIVYSPPLPVLTVRRKILGKLLSLRGLSESNTAELAVLAHLPHRQSMYAFSYSGRKGWQGMVISLISFNHTGWKKQRRFQHISLSPSLKKDVSCFCFRPEEQLVSPFPDLFCDIFPGYNNLI